MSVLDNIGPIAGAIKGEDGIQQTQGTRKGGALKSLYDTIVDSGVMQNVTTKPDTQSGYVPGKFYADFQERFKGKEPETSEQKAEREKKEQRNLRLAMIGDALTAFSNAYARGRGTQPYVTPGTSLSGAMRDRYDMLRKEREANDRYYYQEAMRAQQMDQQAANADRNWRAQLERNKIQDERYKAEIAEKKAAREAAEKAKKEKNDYLTQHDIAKAQGNRQLAAYYKALSEGKTEDQAKAIAAFTPKTTSKKGRGGSSRYASSKTQGNTTIYYDKDGNEVKRVVRKPGVDSGGNGGNQVDANGNIIINY